MADVLWAESPEADAKFEELEERRKRLVEEGKRVKRMDEQLKLLVENWDSMYRELGEIRKLGERVPNNHKTVLQEQVVQALSFVPAKAKDVQMSPLQVLKLVSDVSKEITKTTTTSFKILAEKKKAFRKQSDRMRNAERLPEDKRRMAQKELERSAQNLYLTTTKLDEKLDKLRQAIPRVTAVACISTGLVYSGHTNAVKAPLEDMWRIYTDHQQLLQQ